ncbi:MAG: PqiC family protein [Candidatus Omnitrophota bacterium]
MKQVSLRFGCVLIFICLSLGGCISISNTPSPRFYSLIALDKGQAVKQYHVPAGFTIGVGPVKIPEFLNRPQIVTMNKKRMLEFAEFDRWGEGLDFAFVRLMNEDLTLMMPDATIEMYPWNLNIAITYQVVVNVIALESRLDQDMLLIVQWTIIDQKNKKAIFTKRSELRQVIEPHSYLGLVKSLSAACAVLSEEVAAELSLLAAEYQAAEVEPQEKSHLPS